MEPLFAEDLLTWGQLGLCCAGAVAILVWSVSQLFKSMGTSYGQIIVMQGDQLKSQGVQIKEQGTQIREMIAVQLKSEEDCDKQILALRADFERNHTENKASIRSLTDSVVLKAEDPENLKLRFDNIIKGQETIDRHIKAGDDNLKVIRDEIVRLGGKLPELVGHRTDKDGGS